MDDPFGWGEEHNFGMIRTVEKVNRRNTSDAD